MFTPQPYSACSPGSRWITLAGLVLALSGVGGCREALTPEIPTLTGEWIATKDAARTTFFPAADTFRFALVQADTLIQGTWGATGPEGTVVRPDQQVSGRVVDGEVRLALTYSRYDHGCTGPARECYDSYYRMLGEVRSSNEIHGRVIGPPHPWLPDSELQSHAEWILRRR